MNPNHDFEDVVREAVDKAFIYNRSLEPEEDSVLTAELVIAQFRNWMGRNGIVFYQP